MGTHWMIFLTIGNLSFFFEFPLRRCRAGADLAAPCERKDLPVLGCYGDGDLVEGRVGNLIGFNLWSSLNHSRQDLRYFCIGLAVVSFRVLWCVPEADSERFCSPWGNEGDFILEPLLFSKKGKNVLFDPLGEFRNAIGLQLHGYSACKHGNLLGCRGQGPIPDNPL